MQSGDAAVPGNVSVKLGCPHPAPPPSDKSMSSPAWLTPLPRAFFSRDPRRVARDLLGKVLVRTAPGIHLSARVVEVEAYLGSGDPAAHSAAGHTARTAVLFGPPGYAYVYFVYGNHYCLNVSCQPEGKAGCVLFRALEPLSGIPEMAAARGTELHSGRDLHKLTSGPGRLAQAFRITRSRDNGCDLTCSHSSLWLSQDGFMPKNIQLTPRIGITKATESRLRYLLAGSRFVSAPSFAKKPRRTALNSLATQKSMPD